MATLYRVDGSAEELKGAKFSRKFLSEKLKGFVSISYIPEQEEYVVFLDKRNAFLIPYTSPNKRAFEMALPICGPIITLSPREYCDDFEENEII